MLGLGFRGSCFSVFFLQLLFPSDKLRSDKLRLKALTRGSFEGTHAVPRGLVFRVQD